MRRCVSREALACALALLVLCVYPACSDTEAGDGDADVDVDGDGDSDSDVEEDGAACIVPCGDGCCDVGERCFSDECIPDNGDCGEEEPCQNDTNCVDGICVPFGTGPLGDFDATCTREPEPLTSFEPEIQCEWPGDFEIEQCPGYTNVVTPPLVGDLDGDGVPEIVFVSTSQTLDDPFNLDYDACVRVIRGDDCSPVWTSERSQAYGEALAIADLDGDGTLEVCGRGNPYTGYCDPYCLDSEGGDFWDELDEIVSVDCDFEDTGVSVVNVDGEDHPEPEVVVGMTVFDGLTGRLRSAYETPMEGLDSSSELALADVNGDGHVEALTGTIVYDLVDGGIDDWDPDLVLGNGYTAVAELDANYEGPEVVVVSPLMWEIRVHSSLDGHIIYRHEVPGENGGPPTVADLDGDGRAEFATAGKYYLTAFDLDCYGPRAPDDPGICVNEDEELEGEGIMWSVDTQELSSGVTGSSVFDFEGDGAVEIVYADECWVRVFDGATGAVKFSAPHESGTWSEYPVVADVDGDFYTEIVVPHNQFCGDRSVCDETDPITGERHDRNWCLTGITVYRDRHDRWAPSRPLWSQHTEHLSNRLDDGTVPVVELPSWDGHNSYRQAHPREGGSVIDTPDLTVGGLEAPECDRDAMRQTLRARVCNRGTLPVARGMDVAFRIDEPDGEIACSATTSETLEPGRCEIVECTWEEVPLNEVHTIHAVVDPNGEEGISECHEDNNTATLDVRCPPVIG